MADARKPRLTEKLLREDLPVALAELDEDIAYLSDALIANDAPDLSPSFVDLRRRYTEKRASLLRVRGWLAGMAEAVTQQRIASIEFEVDA